MKILQRLSAKDKTYLVGLIEGDGWFSISKNGIYAKYVKGIEIPQTDLPLLKIINEKLGNKGKFTTRKRSENHIYKSILKFGDKQFLLDVIIPIFDEFPKLTDKFWKYQLFRHH